MGFFSSLFGSKSNANNSSAEAGPVRLSSADEVRHQIEATECELHEAEDRLVGATDAAIKSSLEFLVNRKKQAISDLKEKLSFFEKQSPQK